MIHFVVAYSTNYVIAKDGKIPWHLQNDLRYVKTLTTGHTILMGRRTFESIGKPLPGRKNIVLTKQRNFRYPGVEVVHELSDILQLDDIYVLGGAQIFLAMLHVVDRMHITEVHCIIEGDTFFPQWDKSQFNLESSTPGTVDERNPIPHTFCVYNRVRRDSHEKTASEDTHRRGDVGRR